MTRKQKRDASKAKRRAVISKLRTGLLTEGDWSIICASLIHEREELLGAAEEWVATIAIWGSTRNDVLRLQSFQSKAKRTNAVLVRLGHPAAFSDKKMEKEAGG